MIGLINQPGYAMIKHDIKLTDGTMVTVICSEYKTREDLIKQLEIDKIWSIDKKEIDTKRQ